MTDEELEQQLQDFAEHRQFIKKPMSPIAIKQLKSRAIRMRAAGVDIREAFDRAILNGWQSIYPPSDMKTNKPAAHSTAPLPDYGTRTEPTEARNNIANIRQLVRR